MLGSATEPAADIDVNPFDVADGAIHHIGQMRAPAVVAPPSPAAIPHANRKQVGRAIANSVNVSFVHLKLLSKNYG